MKILKTALVLCVLAFSTATLAAPKNTQCESKTSGKHHPAIMDGTRMTIQNEEFSFVESHTLSNGRDLFLFVNSDKSHVLGLALDADLNMIYMISDKNKNVLDEGVCKSE